jgi:hypothetical protein
MSRVIEVVRRGPRGTDGIAGASGAKIFISSQDASASATLNFTGFDGALYDGYEFDLHNIIPATDAAGFSVAHQLERGLYLRQRGLRLPMVSQNCDGCRLPCSFRLLSRYNGMPMTRAVGNAAGEDGVSGVTADLRRRTSPRRRHGVPRAVRRRWNNACKRSRGHD